MIQRDYPSSPPVNVQTPYREHTKLATDFTVQLQASHRPLYAISRQRHRNARVPQLHHMNYISYFGRRGPRRGRHSRHGVHEGRIARRRLPEWTWVVVLGDVSNDLTRSIQRGRRHNATQYDWKRTFQHSKNAWDFPYKIAAFTSVSIYVKFDEDVNKTPSDDAGEVDFQLQGTPAGRATFRLAVTFKDLWARFSTFAVTLAPNTNIPVGGQIELGWRHDGTVVFILAGQYPNLHAFKNAN
ncbi:hypothetical protein BD414DRAFT_530901 [Trametes punicea]|nr:hypothetical protein BD414DRAFT_530901 [Trametes punicea]